MNIATIAITILLGAAVIVQWICAVGLIVTRNPYDRLHAVSPANILPGLLIAGAVIMQTGGSAASIKTLIIAFTLILTSPVITHVLAHATRNRHTGKR